MVVDVSPIKEQKGASLRVDGVSPCPHLEVEGGAVEGCSPVRVRGQVTRTGKGYLVELHLTTRVRLECTRCLAPFVLLLERDVQEMFYPEALRGQVSEEGDVVSYFSGDTLDLSEPIRENLQLALPMKRLCREACRGLCPVCGQNRNEGDCGCRPQLVDPRWSALARWLAAAQQSGPDGKER